MVSELQSKSAAKLTSSGGGKLGIIGVKEIVVGVRDLNDATDKWQLAMGRKIGPSGRFKFDRGPDVRLAKSNNPGIMGIAFTINSKAKARRFLESRQLLGPETRYGITIKPSAIGGLSVQLVKE